MIFNESITAPHLPEITVYAGDTTPWVIRLIKEDGAPLFSDEDVENATCTLTIFPSAVANISQDSGEEAVLEKEDIQVTLDLQGNSFVTFNFDVADTAELYGKYLYQIDVDNGVDKRVSQGFVTFKQNKRTYSE